MNPNDPNNPQGGTPPADSPAAPEPGVPPDMGTTAEQPQEPTAQPMGGEGIPQTSANCHCGKPSAGGNCTGCNQPEAGCSCTPAA